MTRSLTRRRRYSERQHDVETRPLPVVYRCSFCRRLHFGPVRPDSLFGYCKHCHLHRHFYVATDPEARQWAAMRVNPSDAAVGSGDRRPGPESCSGSLHEPAPDPFYPTGTEW